MKKRYILLKDSPMLKKGAIVEEECDDGTQDYICININQVSKTAAIKDTWKGIFEKTIVETDTKWFKQIKALYLSPEEIVKVKKFLKKK